MYLKASKTTPNICSPEQLLARTSWWCACSGVSISCFSFSSFYFSLFHTVSSSPPGMLPLLNEDFFLLCNSTFFFYFRFLKSYLRNFGVAPDSAVLMVIERGIQTEHSAAPLKFTSPERRFSHTDSPKDSIKFVFVRAALRYILFFLKWSRMSWKLSQLPKGIGEVCLCWKENPWV